MKLKKQVIIPIVVGATLAASATTVAVATLGKQQNKPFVDPTNYDLFEINGKGELLGFKSSVTQEQINEYTKDGKLYLPACKVIASRSFSNNGLELPFGTEIVIDNETTTIGQYAFYGCTASSMSFKSPDDPVALNTIGDYAFAECKQLEAFAFGPQMGYIGQYAFFNCESLRMLDFTRSVNGSQLFASEQAAILNNITIGTSAFAGLFPTAGEIESNPLVIKVAQFDSATLGAYNEYGSRFVLSQLASKIQMQTDIATSRFPTWIHGLTTDGYQDQIFEIRNILPIDWMIIDGGVLKGVNPAYKPLMKIMSFNAIQLPEGVTQVDKLFWDSLPDAQINNITDLDLYFDTQMSDIPDEFLYDENAGCTLLPNLQYVRLATTTKTIGDKAFFGGVTSQGASQLRWVNINEIMGTSLTSIGNYAFAANPWLNSFDKNPNLDPGVENYFEVKFDYKGTAVSFGEAAFEQTGIQNIRFTNPGSDLTLGDNCFGMLRLKSLQFQDFRYNATISGNTITIDQADPVVASLRTLFPGDYAHGLTKQVFGGSFDNLELDGEGRALNFIEIPHWRDSAIQSAYSDFNYFKNATPSGITIVNGLPFSLDEAFLSQSMSPEQYLKYIQWNILHDSFACVVTDATPGEEKAHLTSSTMSVTGAEEARLPYTITDGFTLSDDTRITVYGQPINSWTSRTIDGQKYIIIPAADVIGPIVVTFATKNAESYDFDSTPTTDTQISSITCPAGVKEGNDVVINFGITAGYTIDPDATIIQSGDRVLAYNEGDWSFAVDGYAKSGTITIPESEIYGNIVLTAVSKVEVIHASFEYKREAFLKEPPQYVEIDRSKDFETNIGILNPGYGFDESNIRITQTGHEIQFTFDAAKGTITVAKEDIGYGDMLIQLPTIELASVTYNEVEHMGYETKPEYVNTNADASWKLTFEGGYKLDTANTTVYVDGGKTYTIGDGALSYDPTTGILTLKQGTFIQSIEIRPVVTTE